MSRLTPINLMEAKKAFFKNGCKDEPNFQYNVSQAKMRKDILKYGAVSYDLFELARAILEEVRERYDNVVEAPTSLGQGKSEGCADFGGGEEEHGDSSDDGAGGGKSGGKKFEKDGRVREKPLFPEDVVKALHPSGGSSAYRAVTVVPRADSGSSTSGTIGGMVMVPPRDRLKAAGQQMFNSSTSSSTSSRMMMTSSMMNNVSTTPASAVSPGGGSTQYTPQELTTTNSSPGTGTGDRDAGSTNAISSPSSTSQQVEQGYCSLSGGRSASPGPGSKASAASSSATRASVVTISLGLFSEQQEQVEGPGSSSSSAIQQPPPPFAGIAMMTTGGRRQHSTAPTFGMNSSANFQVTNNQAAGGGGHGQHHFPLGGSGNSGAGAGGTVLPLQGSTASISSILVPGGTGDLPSSPTQLVTTTTPGATPTPGASPAPVAGSVTNGQGLQGQRLLSTTGTTSSGGGAQISPNSSKSVSPIGTGGVATTSAIPDIESTYRKLQASSFSVAEQEALLRQELEAAARENADLNIVTSTGLKTASSTSPGTANAGAGVPPTTSPTGTSTATNNFLWYTHTNSASSTTTAVGSKTNSKKAPPGGTAGTRSVSSSRSSTPQERAARRRKNPPHDHEPMKLKGAPNAGRKSGRLFEQNYMSSASSSSSTASNWKDIHGKRASVEEILGKVRRAKLPNQHQLDPDDDVEEPLPSSSGGSMADHGSSLHDGEEIEMPDDDDIALCRLAASSTSRGEQVQDQDQHFLDEPGESSGASDSEPAATRTEQLPRRTNASCPEAGVRVIAGPRPPGIGNETKLEQAPGAPPRTSSSNGKSSSSSARPTGSEGGTTSKSSTPNYHTTSSSKGTTKKVKRSKLKSGGGDKDKDNTSTTQGQGSSSSQRTTSSRSNGKKSFPSTASTTTTTTKISSEDGSGRLKRQGTPAYPPPTSSSSTAASSGGGSSSSSSTTTHHVQRTSAFSSFLDSAKAGGPESSSSQMFDHKVNNNRNTSSGTTGSGLVLPSRSEDIKNLLAKENTSSTGGISSSTLSPLQQLLQGMGSPPGGGAGASTSTSPSGTFTTVHNPIQPQSTSTTSGGFAAAPTAVLSKSPSIFVANSKSSCALNMRPSAANMFLPARSNSSLSPSSSGVQILDNVQNNYKGKLDSPLAGQPQQQHPSSTTTSPATVIPPSHTATDGFEKALHRWKNDNVSKAASPASPLSPPPLVSPDGVVDPAGGKKTPSAEPLQSGTSGATKQSGSGNNTAKNSPNGGHARPSTSGGNKKPPSSRKFLVTSDATFNLAGSGDSADGNNDDQVDHAGAVKKGKKSTSKPGTANGKSRKTKAKPATAFSAKENSGNTSSRPTRTSCDADDDGDDEVQTGEGCSLEKKQAVETDVQQEQEHQSASSWTTKPTSKKSPSSSTLKDWVSQLPDETDDSEVDRLGLAPKDPFFLRSFYQNEVDKQKMYERRQAYIEEQNRAAAAGGGRSADLQAPPDGTRSYTLEQASALSNALHKRISSGEGASNQSTSGTAGTSEQVAQRGTRASPNTGVAQQDAPGGSVSRKKQKPSYVEEIYGKRFCDVVRISMRTGKEVLITNDDDDGCKKVTDEEILRNKILDVAMGYLQRHMLERIIRIVFPKQKLVCSYSKATKTMALHSDFKVYRLERFISILDHEIGTHCTRGLNSEIMEEPSWPPSTEVVGFRSRGQCSNRDRLRILNYVHERCVAPMVEDQGSSSSSASGNNLAADHMTKQDRDDPLQEHAVSVAGAAAMGMLQANGTLPGFNSVDMRRGDTTTVGAGGTPTSITAIGNPNEAASISKPSAQLRKERMAGGEDRTPGAVDVAREKKIMQDLAAISRTANGDVEGETVKNGAPTVVVTSNMGSPSSSTLRKDKEHFAGFEDEDGGIESATTSSSSTSASNNKFQNKYKMKQKDSRSSAEDEDMCGGSSLQRELLNRAKKAFENGSAGGQRDRDQTFTPYSDVVSENSTLQPSGSMSTPNSGIFSNGGFQNSNFVNPNSVKWSMLPASSSSGAGNAAGRSFSSLLSQHHLIELVQRFNFQKRSSTPRERLRSEEGLAALNTHQYYKDKLLWQPAYVYYCVCMSERLSFVELFEHLKRFTADPDHRWRDCVRAKRGCFPVTSRKRKAALAYHGDGEQLSPQARFLLNHPMLTSLKDHEHKTVRDHCKDYDGGAGGSEHSSPANNKFHSNNNSNNNSTPSVGFGTHISSSTVAGGGARWNSSTKQAQLHQHTASYNNRGSSNFPSTAYYPSNSTEKNSSSSSSVPHYAESRGEQGVPSDVLYESCAKDQAYFEGAIEILRRRHEIDFDIMHAGKVLIRDAIVKNPRAGFLNKEHSQSSWNYSDTSNSIRLRGYQPGQQNGGPGLQMASGIGGGLSISGGGNSPRSCTVSPPAASPPGRGQVESTTKGNGAAVEQVVVGEFSTTSNTTAGARTAGTNGAGNSNSSPSTTSTTSSTWSGSYLTPQQQMLQFQEGEARILRAPLVRPHFLDDLDAYLERIEKMAQVNLRPRRSGVQTLHQQLINTQRTAQQQVRRSVY
ncbi:unnamed protein product [Amoebophrya sp. A25]|nr:unnamed protein product [Amoebophrya sp. A25]|eukprot:GSA25T00016998001.1